MARNIENGGSVTIIATILVDTGSRMDQLIFEEFKGTGNSEIVLDRATGRGAHFSGDQRRRQRHSKEERLYSPEDSRRIAMLRRALADRSSKEAMVALLKLLEKHATNEDLLQSISGGG